MEALASTGSMLGAAGAFLSGPHRGAILTTLAIGALAILAALLVFLIYRDAERNRQSWVAFRKDAEQRGLGEEEQSLAACIADLAGAKNPNLVLTDERAFNQGLSALAEGSSLPRRTGRGRSEICGTCIFLASLREKLGFEPAPGQARATSVRLGDISEGGELTVLRQRSGESFRAVVTGQRKRDAQLLVRADLAAPARVGETWVVRYPHSPGLWEFTAWVVARRPDRQIALKPVGSVRWVNRRRFLRSYTRKPAYVARFPFTRDYEALDPPEFHSATLIEIGGPGLRLRVPLEAERGERVLVVVELRPDKVIEAVGIVRRATPDEGGQTILAVELLGPDTSEVAELMRETNRAALSVGANGAEADEAVPSTERSNVE